MPPWPSPRSNGAPAQAARSPSPEQSMKMRPITAARPDLVSTISARMVSSASITHAGAERVEQDFGAVAEQQIVGRAFVGRGVVGLRLDLAERDMRLVQAAEPVDARQQFVGDAVHHLAVLAVDVGVQAAERGDAGGGAHAAEKAVALDHQRLAAVRRGRCRGRDAGRSAAQHHHVVFAPHRQVAFRLADGFRSSWRHDSLCAASRTAHPAVPVHRRACAMCYRMRLSDRRSECRVVGVSAFRVTSSVMSVQEQIKRLTAPDIRARKGGEPIVCADRLSRPHRAAGRQVLRRDPGRRLARHGACTGSRPPCRCTLDMMILQGHAVMRGSSARWSWSTCRSAPTRRRRSRPS